MTYRLEAEILYSSWVWKERLYCIRRINILLIFVFRIGRMMWLSLLLDVTVGGLVWSVSALLYIFASLCSSLVLSRLVWLTRFMFVLVRGLLNQKISSQQILDDLCVFVSF